MKIAIDISPISSDGAYGHKVRGSGFYIENLKNALFKYCPDNKYVFFSQGKNLANGIDITHYPYFDPFFLSLPFFVKNKVVTVHDLIPFVFPKDFPVGLKGKVKWQIQELSLKNSAAVITDSFSSKRDIVKITKIDKNSIHVVYLAADERYKIVEDKNKKSAIQKKYDLPEKFVLYVGDVTKNKNLPRIIEAVKRVNINLVLAGKALVNKDFDRENSWNSDLLKVQKETENDKRLRFLGFVSTEDLVLIYNLARVYVAPSLYEGFGLPVLEALSCGCPVVTSRAGSLPEVVSQSAFYVDAYDVDNIADGIYKVFNNEKLQKELSLKGIRQSKNFSWEKTAKETMKVYEKIVKGKSIPD